VPALRIDFILLITLAFFSEICVDSAQESSSHNARRRVRSDDKCGEAIHADYLFVQLRLCLVLSDNRPTDDHIPIVAESLNANPT
jgi:hypothetical protein